MKHEYFPMGVCSSRIEFEIENDIVKNVSFTGGCDGNLKAVSSLVDGMTVEQIEEKLLGIRCDFKDTSCSDQLARAIIEAHEKEGQ